MASFPRATGMTRGYARPQVDRFLARVQEALEGAPGAAGVTAAEIRRAGFDLVRGGYDVTAVDAHLDVLELRALAAERRAAVPGARTAADDAGAGVPEELLDVLDAAPGTRFARAGGLRRGYAPREVDAFLAELAATLDGAPVGEPLDAESVRRAVFHVRFRGYDEAQVDDALDLAVDVLLRRDRLQDAPPAAHPGPAAAHDAEDERTARVEGAPREVDLADAAPLSDDTVVIDRRIDRVS
ncbi:DivIVA domain-containing protein [Vallicoccus soli]|uniref:DivIVA domain-containing protein n=1 Tax=Vallicoccus soli TaxID=2339232 RepID=A0A3A3Z5N5_9ACTN|nr:DivIVA domain-containing protein [Vallicoccus soli]RJK98278.1 DivIVA domain-containing protein [Vallicoccus soli]